MNSVTTLASFVSPVDLVDTILQPKRADRSFIFPTAADLAPAPACQSRRDDCFAV